ncbi:flagellar export protein FliJ [Denitrificimonas sp. JX-1]|uniref:Flagellar FliJ protein n=1 Tax=Denitrificimonas halotolerans TaxID=3098930 RepID=A0ABU5GRR4_9GAMM|nr:flagellar export protein FliJ [Denitrificimonas sp. JX-1]MDY7219683.1 flagellar export protein FliJ [Denitrificimonas sp. JX-1]
MNTSTPLDTLIELAREARDQAAQMLASERRNQNQLNEQLTLLNNYRLEYASRLQELLHSGIEPATLHNYQQFLSSLDASIARAYQAINQQQQRVISSQKNWQQQQRKLSSYTTLNNRRADEATRQMLRNEQRQNDELTTNAFARKSKRGFTP